MGLFTADSAYLCYVWQFAAKIVDNTHTYCWHVYALNVSNMKTWQYCNILSSKIKFTQYLWPFAAVSDFMASPGANLLHVLAYTYIFTRVKHNEYIIKSTKSSVYDKVWLNKNIKAFYHKTCKLGDPTPRFASVYSRNV